MSFKFFHPVPDKNKLDLSLNIEYNLRTMRYFSALFFFLIVLPMTGFSQTYRATDNRLAPFIRAVYMQQTPDAEIEKQAVTLLKSLETDSALEPEDRLFASARVYYYLGKNYLFFDSKETIFKHNALQKKGSFVKLKEFYTEADTIRDKYNRSLEILNGLEETAAFKNDIYCLKAAVLSDLCLVSSVGFVLINGPRLLSYVNAVLKEAPQHPQTLLQHICSKAYPPGIYGGDPKEAIDYLNRLEPQFDSLSEGEQFDFLCAKAFASGRLGHYDDGIDAINRALLIFPTNCYANAVKELLGSEEF